MIKRLLIISIVCFFTQVNYAVDLELTQGINAAMPIAVNAFGGDQAGQELNTVVMNDLKLCGQFKLIAQSGQDARAVQAWRQAGADSVLSAQITKNGMNRYAVSFELADAVNQGKVLLSKTYQVSGHDLRALAHHISDEVYQKLTGERGIFSTRIAYVFVQRKGEKARYSLEVADVDGYNPQSLLVSTEPIMSPSWSPDGTQIAYVSFERKKAQISIVSVETGQRRLITDFPGINSAPAWSMDGRYLAVVLSKSGATKLYTVDLSNGNLKQLTSGEAIDTEPRFSPDGRSLLFTSGRGGSPQIYRFSLADGQITRMTYDGNYNAKASYTPNQRNIVMMHRGGDGQFNISTQSTENSQITNLTSASMDESPSVAPNGRLILYATRHLDKGVLAMVSIDGHIRLQFPSREGDVQEPAWSPYLG